jgi:hypothetical protein
MSEESLLCARCLKELHPGQQSFYVVEIKAYADPTMPDVTKEELEKTDFTKALEELYRRSRHMSKRELMDQIHRQLTIHLCSACYAQWIENPAG